MKNKLEIYYESLYQAAAAMNSARSPGQILQSMVETVAKAVEAKGCSLMLLSADEKVLEHTAAFGLSDWYIRKGPVSADKSLHDALEGKVVSALNAPEDERIQYREQAKKEGIATILSVPMRLHDKIVGVVRVYTAEPRHFSEEDIHFISAVANLGAIALENAKLYETLKKDYESFRRDMLEHHPLRDW